MHGVPRQLAKPKDEASIAKSSNLRSLQSQLLDNHHNKIYTKEALESSSKLLETNPELYTAWNYRKLAVEHNLGIATDQDSIKSILDEELRVVESALRANFKSYGAWHHRKWILKKKECSSLDREFKLLDKLFKVDSRNFHAWKYRSSESYSYLRYFSRFVAELNNVPEEEELKHTQCMIDMNFSNYSAWHNRSAILSHLVGQKAHGFISKEEVLTDEFELVHNAIFTDTDDQSGWFYHHWLLDQTVAQDAPVLVSSWPIHSSELIVSLSRNFYDPLLSPSTIFCSDAQTFPLILYFSQAVEGVSSCTVSVEFTFCNNDDLIWRPLSSNKSGKSKAWATYLNFPNREHHSLKVYPVEVSVGHSPGIISSSGFNCSFPLDFAFTVGLQSIDQNVAEGAETKMMVWENNHFYTNESLLHDFRPTILSLDRLKITKDYEPTASKWHLETLTSLIDLFRDLSDCKIGKLTLARLLTAHDVMMSYTTNSVYKKVNFDEILGLFSDLMILDPPHSRYYKDQHSLVLMEQVTSNRESLAKHCWYYGDSTSDLQKFVCLRLNELSISRLGFYEHILWVQMLDLSHNELQSVEGLESLQLLSCLNLSHNKLSSFTALEPLKQLKSLKALDLSYNEIGKHSIDTTRYLCSSPLSHSLEDGCNIGDYANEGIEVFDYWETVLFSKGLQLIQLDIVGNKVSDEKFRALLLKLLSSLKWLDGKSVN
ncbi:hypothetical protein GIB67_019565 [Kingdonia uniflora]|uniref:Geranylgeranyl transferase type-2 subunit alpha n=1 Tax=Kingdonia uniflora TaxID=39325 RepID=A0A7J7N0B7_9MAGN|nr:hypothetical protein GIB67_019565 [Kingdonia uniflora]